jgi:flagellar motor switch protein FliM
VSEVLNQDQIAAMFEAAKSGDQADPTPQARRPQRMRSVDFSRPTKFTSDHQRRLSRMIETFCLAASARMTAELRTTVEMETLNTTQVTWAAAQTLLPTNSLAATITLDPIGTRILMCIESQFVLTVIEGMLGGSTARAAKPRRFSEIDWMLSRRIVDSIVYQLAASWHDLAGDINLVVEDVDEQADSTSIASVSEPTFIVMIEARMAAQSAAVALLIPWSAIDPIAEQISGRDEHPQGVPRSSGIDQALAHAPVTIRAEVAALTLPVTDILSLEPGSVIRLGALAADGISLYAENVKLARAQPGANGVRRAVQVQYHEMDDDS